MWSALNSGCKHLGSGNTFAKYFDKDIAPFAGLAKLDAAHLQKLYDLLPIESSVALVIPVNLNFPKPWQIVHQDGVLQLTFEQTTTLTQKNENFIPLDTRHVPAMIELTAMTKPGPFLQRTIEFGHYIGIFDGEKLVAMAGFRMQIENYIEISAVCTHPDYTGKGYGTMLLTYLVNQILAKGKKPFLHVRASNQRAIGLYESLGFKIRQTLQLSIIKKI